MGKAELNGRTLPEFVRRLEALNPDTARRWGTLDTTRLMPHLRWLVEVSLEEVQAEEFPVPFAKTAFFQWLVIHLPWPKGKMKAPDEAFPKNSGSFEEEREKLVATLKRFAEAVDKNPHRKTRSPIMGPIPLKSWAQLHAKHFNHHFDQFGV